MFDQQYPHLSAWILGSDGWIELGQVDFSRFTVRILDIGGLIWESDQRYKTVAQALEAAELALAQWIEENLSTGLMSTDLHEMTSNGTLETDEQTLENNVMETDHVANP